MHVEKEFQLDCYLRRALENSSRLRASPEAFVTVRRVHSDPGRSRITSQPANPLWAFSRYILGPWRTTSRWGSSTLVSWTLSRTWRCCEYSKLPGLSVAVFKLKTTPVLHSCMLVKSATPFCGELRKTWVGKVLLNSSRQSVTTNFGYYLPWVTVQRDCKKKPLIRRSLVTS